MQQVRVPKMAEVVATQLRRAIVQKRLQEGEALASENDLMEQFQVSRPTLREAFRLLESDSLISIKRGSRGGARVLKPSDDIAARSTGLILEYRDTMLEDVLEARTVLEAPCVGLLARRRTPQDLKQLHEALSEADGVADDAERLVEAQNAFHSLLVELAGNNTLAVVNSVVHNIIEKANRSNVAAHVGTTFHAAASARGSRAHRRVVELIEESAATEAEELWRRHTTEAQAHLLDGGGAKTVLDLLS